MIIFVRESWEFRSLLANIEFTFIDIFGQLLPLAAALKIEVVRSVYKRKGGREGRVRMEQLLMRGWYIMNLIG